MPAKDQQAAATNQPPAVSLEEVQQIIGELIIERRLMVRQMAAMQDEMRRLQAALTAKNTPGQGPRIVKNEEQGKGE